MAVNEPDEPVGPHDARIAALYREAATEEPPAHLDRAIRDAARAAAGSGARLTPSWWWTMWRVPFAAAALVVVCASVVVLMVEEGAHQVGEMPMDARAPAPGAQPPQQAPVERVTVLPPGAQPKAESASAEREAADRDAAKNAEEASRARERRAEPARPSTGQAGRSADRGAPGTAAPAPPSAPSGPAPAAPVPSPPASEGAARDAQLFPLEKAPPRERVDSSIGIRRLEPQQAPSSPPVAESAPVFAVPQAKPTAPSPAAKPAPAPAAKPAPAPPRPLAAEARRLERADAAASPAIAPILAELEGRPPRQWLDRIAALRREARRAEADALLDAFKRRFPEEPVPVESP